MAAAEHIQQQWGLVYDLYFSIVYRPSGIAYMDHNSIDFFIYIVNDCKIGSEYKTT